MPSGDYTAIGGGALKLKGAKVQKKKKKRKDKSDLENNLSSGDSHAIALSKKEGPPAADNTGTLDEDRREQDDELPEVGKTESERRYEEVKRKRVSQWFYVPRRNIAVRTKRNIQRGPLTKQGDLLMDVVIQLQKLAESSSSRPELLKTHKQRVEELNTYLSKLSEHHDMPKIGPG